MKGDNDDSLPWPFSGRVTFEILNLIRNTNHHKGDFIFPPAIQQVKEWKTMGEPRLDTILHAS